MTSRARITGTVAMCLACAVTSSPGAERPDPRLVLSVGVLPQFEQFIGHDDFPAELFGIEYLRPISRRERGTIRVQGRRDLVLLGVGVARDISVSSLREWRISGGVDVAWPLGPADDVVRRWHDGTISVMDRLAVRLGMGQTFDFADSRVGLRVGYDVRVVGRGSVLSILEGLDDEVGNTPTSAVHEVRAALELRLGANP